MQRPLKMISGITTEFGQVTFDDVRVPAGNIVGQPGDGWAMAMTVVGHEREPSTLGYVARYAKTVQSLVPERMSRTTTGFGRSRNRDAAAACVRRRLSNSSTASRIPSEGSLDKLLMTWTEQTVGHAALSVTGTSDPELLSSYLYSRAQSVVGGTSHSEEHHRRTPTRLGSVNMYGMPGRIEVTADGALPGSSPSIGLTPQRRQRHLHSGLASLWNQLTDDPEVRARC